MSKAVDQILNSVIEEFKAGKRAKEELDAKSLFRLLNYCPQSAASVPPQEPQVKRTPWCGQLGSRLNGRRLLMFIATSPASA